MKTLICFALLTFAFPLSLAQTRFELSNESVVQYDASDSNNFSWQGRAPVESVELVLGEALENSSLRIVVKADAFRSGNIIRDADARRFVFEVRQYPEIVFEATGVNAAGALQQGVQEIQLSGNLIMHGVTQPLSVTVMLELTDMLLRATGGFTVLLSDFDMRRPTLLGNTVNDDVRITFDIQGNVQGN